MENSDSEEMERNLFNEGGFVPRVVSYWPVSRLLGIAEATGSPIITSTRHGGHNSPVLRPYGLRGTGH